MRYHLKYNEADLTAAHDFLTRTNPLPSIPNYKEYIHSFMHNNAARNAKRYLAATNPEKDQWRIVVGTVGFTIVMTLYGVSRKGYPQIDADILVSPAIAYGIKYVTEKREIPSP